MKIVRALPLLLLCLILASCDSSESGGESLVSDVTNEVPKEADGPIVVDGSKAAEVLASDPSVTVLDIRTPQEFAAGHLADAVNIDFNAPDFEAKLAALDVTKPYLVHWAGGFRSGKAFPIFEKLHFTRLYHLISGFDGWVADGQPVEK